MSTTSKELLASADLRATSQRVRMLDLLRARTHPSSAEELVRAARGAFDLTTAYRTLETLQGRGLVRKLDVDQSRARFELASDHHHHAVCASCGLIRDVSLCIAPSLDERVRKAVRFERIDTHSLEFFGMCQPCASGTPRSRSK